MNCRKIFEEIGLIFIGILFRNLEENKEDKKNANKQLSSTLNNIKELIQDEENCKHMCELIDEEISGKQSLLESIKLILSKFTN